jgi:hypothetical protein
MTATLLPVALAFFLGLLTGVGTVVLTLRLAQRVERGLPIVGKPQARRLPDQPDAELVVRRKLRQQAVNRGAEDIMERAQASGQRVSLDQAKEQAARLLDDLGFEG